VTAGPAPGRAGLRFGIVGPSGIGRAHAASARLAGGRLVAVAASTPASGERAAAELGADRAEADPFAVAEAPDVDVVHVCTPNHLHEALAVRALAAGKHVVLEKPVAMDAGGAERIAAAAAAAGRVVAVAFVYRFHPTVRRARAMVAAGELGEVRLVHGSYQQDWLLRPTDDDWRVDPAIGGRSRAFADIGSHWCDAVEFVTGDRIRRLAAFTAAVVPGRATEDVVVAAFETAAGVPGSVVVSQVSPGRTNRLWFEVDGSEAAVAFDHEHSDELWFGRREEGSTVVGEPPGDGRSHFDRFVADAYAAVLGSPPEGLPDIAAGVRSAHVVDAVLASAASRAWVEVGG
jgi:predicted dehydrogenase